MCFNFPEEIEEELARELGFPAEQIMWKAHRVGAHVDAMHVAGIDSLLANYEVRFLFLFFSFIFFFLFFKFKLFYFLLSYQKNLYK